MKPSLSVVRNVVLLVGVVAGLTACSNLSDPAGPSPVAPETVTSAATHGAVTVQSRPNAVFRTVPAADGDEAIRGNNPLVVQFNNCQSRPGDEGDDLKYTYDFDNDGTVDAFGHCRAEHTYTGAATASVCVSDRRGNDVCRTWSVRPSAITEDTRVRVSSVTFTVDFIPDGGLAFPWEFYLNGNLLGTTSVSGTPFSCPATPRTFTVTDPAWVDGAPNTLRFLKTGPIAWPAIGWVHVQVTRTDGTSQGSCLFDVDGVGPCMAAPNPCLFPPNNWDPVDVSVNMTVN